MKRFYTLVHVGQEDGAYDIRLDGKPVRTPGRVTLATSSKALAEAVMSEWAAQEERIVPDAMPLTQILTTQIDYAVRERAVLSEKVLGYLDTDLLCYHAPRGGDSEDIARLQEQVWTPWVTWFATRFGHALQTTDGLKALQQEGGVKDALAAYVNGLDDARFMVLQMVTNACGSVVLGLALLEGAISAEQLFEVAALEELYQAKLYDPDGRYGMDPDVARRLDKLKGDIVAARTYLELVS